MVFVDVRGDEMQVVILCGGKGTRMGYMTEDLPKPLIPIGGKPIVHRIMNHFAKLGHTDFLLLTSYKHELFSKHLKEAEKLWDVKYSVVEGNPSKGNGIRNAIDKIAYDEDGDFILSYGDDLCSVDMNKVIKKHKESSAWITLTAIHPKSEFGVLMVDDSDLVTGFREKPVMKHLINGGYMVCSYRAIEFLVGNDDNETDMIKKLSGTNASLVQVYRHIGFWKSMNTIKDMEELNRIFGSEKDGQKSDSVKSSSSTYCHRPSAKPIDLNKEIACTRAVLERILRVMDEGLFLDYQMEKFGRIGYLDGSLKSKEGRKSNSEKEVGFTILPSDDAKPKDDILEVAKNKKYLVDELIEGAKEVGITPEIAEKRLEEHKKQNKK